jgi:hypothetical protein
MSKRYWKFIDMYDSTRCVQRWDDSEHWTHYLADTWICLLIFWEDLGCPLEETLKL